MNINELNSFRISDVVEFHDQLNPRLFSGRRMKPQIRAQLLRIAADFINYMGIKQLDVEDIILTGSNAAYTYTPHSDIDLHILVDFSKLNPDDVYQELFSAKKTQYNDRYAIKLWNYDVELYVQDSNEPHVSAGQYSVLKDRWIKIPNRRRLTIDDTVVKQKLDKLTSIITSAIKSHDTEHIDSILKKLRRYRRASLVQGGEFSAENLAYKFIRNRGLLQRLFDARDRQHGQDLSLPQ